jgi:hypothetical protein
VFPSRPCSGRNRRRRRRSLPIRPG